LVAGKGLVFVSGRDGLHALTARSGRTVWRRTNDRAFDRSIGSGELALSNGVLYASAADPLRVVAIEANSGSVLWRLGLDRLDRSTAVGAPVLAGPHLFLSSRAMELASSRRSETLVIDLATPAIRWTRRGGVVVTAAARRGGLATTAGGTLRMIDSDTGTLMWADRLGRSLTSPTFRGDAVFVANAGGIRNNRAIAVEADTGRVLWRTPLGMWNNPSDSLAVGPSAVIVPWADFEGAGGGLTALDRDGGRLWSRRIDGLPTAPIVVNGVAFVAVTQVVPEPGSEGGTIGRRGRVLAISTRTGHLLWVGRANGVFLARPVVAAGALYVVSRSGTVYAFRTRG
jgi:outer membrane protein assembly factor BamB